MKRLAQSRAVDGDYGTVLQIPAMVMAEADETGKTDQMVR
jgi:hypothetical protein